MAYFDNNSIMHNTLAAVIKYMFKNENNLLLLFNLLVESDLVNTLMDLAMDEWALCRNGHNGYKS